MRMSMFLIGKSADKGTVEREAKTTARRFGRKMTVQSGLAAIEKGNE
jgi:hypothetical protein